MSVQEEHKTLVIVGAGTSLLHVPPDYTFKHHTMALNVSTIAPQFYDYELESFHHTWTYGMFIDNMIANPHYFPEYLYYMKSVDNERGVLFVREGMIDDKLKRRPNLYILPRKLKYKMVLAPALWRAKKLGYESVILVGCDFSLPLDGKRYWWEYPEYCDGILKHPKNNKLVRAKSSTFSGERDRNNTTVGFRGLSIDDSVYYWTDRKDDKKPHVRALDTGDNEVMIHSLLYRQMTNTGLLLDELQDDNFTVFKYKDVGMLNVPVVNDLEEL